MLRKLAALVIIPAVLLGGAAVTSASAADTEAAEFVSKANAERRARGLRAYTVASDLAAVAARHSARMASRHTLYHNSNLGSEVSGWQVVGENVGYGGTVDSIHQAFMDSPAHRANILATDYTEIGVGTVTDSEGVLWVTQVFRLPEQAAQAPKVSAPVTQQASRSVTRTPVSRPAARPAKAVVKAAPKRPAPQPVADRPAPSAFLTALAPPVVASPLAQALVYTSTMSALAR